VGCTYPDPYLLLLLLRRLIMLATCAASGHFAILAVSSGIYVCSIISSGSVSQAMPFLARPRRCPNDSFIIYLPHNYPKEVIGWSGDGMF